MERAQQLCGGLSLEESVNISLQEKMSLSLQERDNHVLGEERTAVWYAAVERPTTCFSGKGRAGGLALMDGLEGNVSGTSHHSGLRLGASC